MTRSQLTQHQVTQAVRVGGCTYDVLVTSGYTIGMTVVLLQDAKDRLEELLTASAKGEEVVIVREDGSTFKLVPEGRSADSPPADLPAADTPAKKKRGLIGSGKGWFTMSADFDEPLEDFEEYM